MIDFMCACKIAIDKFSEERCKKGLYYALDLGDKWLFFGRKLPLGVTEYGSNYAAIDKETGEFVDFGIHDPDNLEIWQTAPEVYIPTKYLIHELRKIRNDKERTIEKTNLLDAEEKKN